MRPQLAALLTPLAFLAFGHQDTIIRTNTRLVEVHVSVHDRKGAFVPNLRREEFHLFDNGKERPISLFVAENSGAATTASSDPAAPGTTAAPRRTRDDSAILLLDWTN